MKDRDAKLKSLKLAKDLSDAQNADLTRTLDVRQAEITDLNRRLEAQRVPTITQTEDPVMTALAALWQQASEQTKERFKARFLEQDAAESNRASNNNSESGDDFEDDGSEVASPAVLEDNIMHAIGGMNENARVFNKLLRPSALDREAATRIITAIDRMMGKWRSIQYTLERNAILNAVRR